MDQPLEPALVLLGKAREDIYLAKKVRDDAQVSVKQMGFLCEQAVEKSLKAVLSRHGVRFRRGHDIAQYLDLLRAANIAYPPELEQCIDLTPFGAELRYDYLPKEELELTPFDRDQVIGLAEQAIEWATTALAGP